MKPTISAVTKRYPVLGEEETIAVGREIKKNESIVNSFISSSLDAKRTLLAKMIEIRDEGNPLRKWYNTIYIVDSGTPLEIGLEEAILDITGSIAAGCRLPSRLECLNYRDEIIKLVMGSLVSPTDVQKALDDMYAAVSKLVLHNIGLVGKYARRSSTDVSPFQDQMNEGAIGLQMAARKYDPERPTSFSSMAVPWIKSTTTSASHRSQHVRIPAKTNAIKNDVLRRLDRLRSSGDDSATVESVIVELGLTKEREKIIRHAMTISVASADAMTGGSEDSGAMYDTIEDKDLIDQGVLMDTVESVSTALGVIRKKMSDRDRSIIRYMYGFGPEGHHEISEVADHFGISSHRVNIIINKMRMAIIDEPKIAPKLRGCVSNISQLSGCAIYEEKLSSVSGELI